MSEILTPDICVIGAGSGGLSVAAAAAAFGVSVTLVEQSKMGGDCLNYGCVPSKALIAAAKHSHSADISAPFGVYFQTPDVDYKKMHDHIHAVISGIAPHDSVERFESLGVRVLQASGVFIAPDTLEAGDVIVKARRFVIATGSSPATPPIPGLDSVSYLTNETLFDLETRPEHLIIIGGGPIGLEMAQAQRRLGAEVTVVEAGEILAKDDPEAVEIIRQRLRAEGVTLLEKTAVKSVTPAANASALVEVNVTSKDASPDGERVLTGSHILLATGRKANTAGLGLSAANVEHGKQGITVDGGMRTSNRRIYAIGDVAGGLQFTHVAGYHAGLVIRSALFRLPVRENRRIIPWVTYTEPKIGHIGLSEEQARARYGTAVKILRGEYHDNDRARAERATTGHLKLVVGKGGRLLGADIVGANADEILNLLSLALSKNMKMRDLAGFVSPYPTLSEIVRRTAISYYKDTPTKPLIRQIVKFLAKFG